MSLPEKQATTNAVEYPRWLAERIRRGEPLLTEADQKALHGKFAALLRRIAKPKQEIYRRHSERLLIIRELLWLKVDPLMADCMYACLRANKKTLADALSLLRGGEPARGEEQLSAAEIDRILSDIERLSWGEGEE